MKILIPDLPPGSTIAESNKFIVIMNLNAIALDCNPMATMGPLTVYDLQLKPNFTWFDS